MSTAAATSSVLDLGPYAAAGTVFTIAAGTDDLARRLTSVLVDLEVPESAAGQRVRFRFEPASGAPRRTWRVWRDEEPCETVTDSYVVRYALWEITRLALEVTTHLLPIHAAALTLNSQAIVLAGVSEMGKSTLAGWLTGHGWGFLTDEVAIVTRAAPGWAVRPFHRPIGVRHPSPLDPLVGWEPTEPESLLPASRLGTLSDTTRLAAIILPSRGRDVPRSLEPIHPATALRELWTHLPNQAGRGRAGFDEAVALVRDIPAYRLGVGDLADAELTLRAFVGARDES